MRVSDILKAKGDRVVSIHEGVSLAEAARGLEAANIGALVVEDGRGGLAGVLSEREIVHALARFGADAMRRPVREAMVRGPAIVAPGEPVQQAMAVMTERRTRHLPVVENGRVVGLLSIGDVVKSRLDEKLAENRVLQDIARFRHAA